MFHYFMINPHSGKKKRDKLIEQIKLILPQRNLPYEIEVTKSDESMADMCRRAVLRHPEGITVYACGGDGTISAAAQGVAGLPHACVTQIPCGSGNDFLRLFGDTSVVFGDLEAQLDGTEVRDLDLINVNDTYKIINIGSSGLDARINADVDYFKHLPLVSPWLAYRLSLVTNFVKGISKPMEVELDGQVFKGKVTLATCCNGQYYGSNFHPVPEAKPDDRQLDFLIIWEANRRQALPLINKFEKGRWPELGKFATYVRGKVMTLRSETEMPINLDGETIFTKTVTFKLDPDRVRFHLPKGAQPIW